MLLRFEFHEELWLPWQPKGKKKKKTLKIFFRIWHVASSSGPLPKKLQIMTLLCELALCCGGSDFTKR